MPIAICTLANRNSYTISSSAIKQGQMTPRKMWWLRHKQGLHPPKRTTMQDRRPGDRPSQWGLQLPQSYGDTIFQLLLRLQQTNPIIKSGWHRNQTASHHQLQTITSSGPLREYPYMSSVATSNWHHHLFHSDIHRCQNLYLAPTRQCDGNSREVK